WLVQPWLLDHWIIRLGLRYEGERCRAHGRKSRKLDSVRDLSPGRSQANCRLGHLRVADHPLSVLSEPPRKAILRAPREKQYAMPHQLRARVDSLSSLVCTSAQGSFLLRKIRN